MLFPSARSAPVSSTQPSQLGRLFLTEDDSRFHSFRLRIRSPLVFNPDLFESPILLANFFKHISLSIALQFLVSIALLFQPVSLIFLLRTNSSSCPRTLFLSGTFLFVVVITSR